MIQAPDLPSAPHSGRSAQGGRGFIRAVRTLGEAGHDCERVLCYLRSRFERLEQEYHAITQALRRIEAGLADESGRREILQRDLAELKQHVDALQSRIEEIEQRLGR